MEHGLRVPDMPLKGHTGTTRLDPRRWAGLSHYLFIVTRPPGGSVEVFGSHHPQRLGQATSQNFDSVDPVLTVKVTGKSGLSRGVGSAASTAPATTPELDNRNERQRRLL